MRKLYDAANCVVGEFMVIAAGGAKAPSTVLFQQLPDYSAAEHKAREAATKNPGVHIFIAQITGQLKAVPHVFEVHKTSDVVAGLLEAPKENE